MLFHARMLLDGTYRNPGLLALAEDKPCIRCLVHKEKWNCDATVAAHYTGIYQHLYNKGASHKAHDHCTWWACHECHTEADNPAVSWGQGDKGELQMLYILLTLSIILKTTPGVFRGN